MPKIFICYRREDSQWPAQMIYNNLVDQFGSESVVFDIDTIPLGADFREDLIMEVSKCDVLLAVIGDQWLEILKQRLDKPNDFVRIELQAALQRKIPVVPVLVGRRSVPSETELPPEIAKLSYRQAAEVRVGRDLPAHLKRLVDGLDRLFSEREVGKELKQKQVDDKLKREQTPERYTNTIGMKFVLIPAGRFKMGSKLSPKDVAQRYGGETELFEREHPLHEVAIKKPYYLQSTQVTQEQWRKVIGNNPAVFQDCGIGCSVENVSWDDAQDFIKKLNKMDITDNRYRLPTEAEWEYACRAGTTTEFSFGDDAGQLGEYAWYRDNSEGKTHPAGQKEPNPWGLYDMHGNVWEWVEDDWHGNYDKAPDDMVAWIDKPRNFHRVFRGGSFHGDARRSRSAVRSYNKSDFHRNRVGLRLARSIALGS